MVKPPIFSIRNSVELRKWYWTKLELQNFAKHIGVSASGAKFDILNRLSESLDGRTHSSFRKVKRKSKFNWTTEDISDDTVITDSYKNSQKVRKYMISKIPNFKFNIDFMEWVKANVGKTMSEAVTFYLVMEEKKRLGKYVPEIRFHNQYNKYLRAFFEANPNLTSADARKCWKYKTSKPSQNGLHKYESNDLEAIDE